MRSKDFSKTPPPAQAGEIFYGGTDYTGIRSIIKLGLMWLPFRRAMTRSQGYLGHRVWYRFPYTIGTISFWENRQDLLRFAQSQEHRDAVDWVLTPGVAHSAFIRYLTPRPSGHTVGNWRAEDEPGEPWRIPQYPDSSRYAPEERSGEGPMVAPEQHGEIEGETEER